MHSRSEETRLREHICQLKTIRATIQGTVVDLEPYQGQQGLRLDATSDDINQEQLETAVLRQELMAAKEEIADLKAKVYVTDREKSGLSLTLQEKRGVETMLRTHIYHLQEQMQGKQSTESEYQSRQRIERLFETLDHVVNSSEAKHKESRQLIEDLKKANR